MRLFICGSALRGQPDHHTLGAARLIGEARTQPLYQMHSIADQHPGIYAVDRGGIAISGEIYELTQADYEQLLAVEPPYLYPGLILLEDGTEVMAMLYPEEVIHEKQWPNISSYGSWAAYKQSLL
jgi:gamma-glutamylcyclotransferase (GGCT)/AIG2-like uncharacterized protein YtfP